MIKNINNFAYSLNGSFLIWIIDTKLNVIHLITDRLGSKKAFYLKKDNCVYLSSSLRYLPPCPIDPVGATTYLQNGFIFSGRTVLENVTSLDSASIHSFTTAGITSQEYWKYTFEFNDEIDERNYEEDKTTLASLYRAAVQRRIPRSGRIYISLSGGIDSRAVLGCLIESLDDRGRLIAFSYGEPNDEDVQVAAKLAKKYSIEHRITGFCGDIATTMQRNGNLCEGIVGFYTHGIDGLFNAINDFNEEDVMFVGDLSVQRGKADYRSLSDVLHRIEIHPPAKVPAYFSFGEYDHKLIQLAMEDEINTLRREVNHLDNLEDIHDYLFVRQRLSNMLLTWREYHENRFVTIVNPLLDNEIVDFYRYHPRCYRRDKYLHKITTMSMFPEMCNIPFADSGVSNSSIHRQLQTHRLHLANLINSFDSRLDALLPAELLMVALQDTAQMVNLNQYRIPKKVRTVIDRFRRRFAKFRLIRGIPADKREELSQLPLPALGAHRIELILALRCFLAQN